MGDYETIRIGKNKINFYIEEKGRPIIYMPGRGLKPQLHTQLFQGLEAYDKAPISPYFYGLKKQPHTLEQEADLLNEFCYNLGIKEHDIIGHSSGALTGFYFALKSTNPQKLVALNPVLKKKLSKLKTTTTAVKGIAKNKLGLGSYILGSFKNPHAFIATIKTSNQILNFEYDQLEGSVEQPTLILHGTKDEIYTLDKDTKREIENKFKNVNFKEIKASHIEPITNPKSYLDDIVLFLS